MAERISVDQLVDDLTTVIRDAENLLRATAAQTGDRVDEIRARAEESVRQAKARLEGIEEEAEGSNYRVQEKDDAEPADGSSLRDDSESIEERADGSNYRDESSDT